MKSVVVGFVASLSLFADLPPIAASTLITDELAKLSPTDAAKIVLGDAARQFVEVQPRVPGHWDFGVEFFARPERAVSICRVFAARVSFGAASAGIDAGSANRGGSLNISEFRAGWFYYFEEPASGAIATEASSSGPTCAGPVGRRPVFEAPSLPAALAAVKNVQEVVAAAARAGPIPFQLDVECRFDQSCPDAAAQRSVAAALKPEDIIGIKLIGWKREDVIVQIDFASHDVRRSSWFVRLLFDGPTTGKLRRVEMYNNMSLVP